jgi:hypothetical protein
MQGLSQADSTRLDSTRLNSTRLGADLTARPSSCTLTDAAPQEDVRAISNNEEIDVHRR